MTKIQKSRAPRTPKQGGRDRRRRRGDRSLRGTRTADRAWRSAARRATTATSTPIDDAAVHPPASPTPSRAELPPEPLELLEHGSALAVHNDPPLEQRPPLTTQRRPRALGNPGGALDALQLEPQRSRVELVPSDGNLCEASLLVCVGGAVS